MIDGTGLTNDVFKKRTLRSYPSTLAAGSGQVIGVGIEYYDDISNFTTEDWILSGANAQINRSRDVLAVLVGAVEVVNKGSTNIEVMDTVIPVDGGCEKMTSTAQYSLGKALQPILAGDHGIIWVNADYEKPMGV